MQEQSNEGHRKERVGVVVSDKMDKTVVVAIDSFRRHRIYKKVLRRTARYKAHDEENEASVGDLVRIRESRPLSRLKRWRVVEIVQRHEVAETKPADIDRSMVEELERRRREPTAEEAAAVIQEATADVEEPAEVPEVEEVAAEPEEVTVEEAVEEAIEEVTAEPAEPPVEKAESSEEPAEGPADETPKASRGRRRSAADPAEGAAEAEESEKAEGE